LNFKRIVITGAPGTGKTSVIKALESSDFHCFHEVIRTMTLAVKTEENPNLSLGNPIAFVRDAKQFNKQLLEDRLKQYKDSVKTNQELVFYDRGMPDVLAYMDYFEQVFTKKFLDTCKTYRYDAVFLLPPWQDIYIQDNERLETYVQATELHEHLKNTYTNLGYKVIEVPFGTVAERLSFILEHKAISRA
jgi:predicted ATPase